jgi:hypothetical protein
MKGFSQLLFAGVFILSLTGSGRAGEDYFMLMFSAQRTPNEPDYSHSFATFVRVTWPDSCPWPGFFRYDPQTISWLPANRDVRCLAICPETGCNFDLHTTIKTCLDNGSRVTMWGPYRIQPELYHRAMQEIALLESGQVKYKAIDGRRLDGRVCNCSHALSSVVDGPKLTVASPGWGDVASRYLLNHKFKPWIIDPDRVYPSVFSAIGLDYFPVIRADHR